MKGRRKDYIRLLLIVVVLFLSVVVILYFHLHQVDPPVLRQHRITTASHEIGTKAQNLYTKSGLPRRHLSVGLVTTSTNLPLYDTFKSGADSPNITAHVHSGTLLLLDASNSISFGNYLSIEVVFPFRLWIIVEYSKFSSTIQFVSLFRPSINSNAEPKYSNHQLQDYANECMASNNQSLFCMSIDNSADHPLLRMLTSPYIHLEDYQERRYPAFQFDVEVSHADWTQQLPLMNGRMGAMIGGTRYHEVIPISLENLYAFVKHQKAEEPQVPPVNIHESFEQARRELLAGRVPEASVLMDALRRGKASGGGWGLGTFQGAGDVVIVLGSQFTGSNGNNNNNHDHNQKDLGNTPYRGTKAGIKRGIAFPNTRRGLVEGLRTKTSFAAPPQPPHPNPKDKNKNKNKSKGNYDQDSHTHRELRFNRLSLDLLHATASQQVLWREEADAATTWIYKTAFLYGMGGDKKGSGEGGLVYRWRCVQVEGGSSPSPLVNLTSSSACLHAAVSLTRDGAETTPTQAKEPNAGWKHQLGGRVSYSSAALPSRRVQDILRGLGDEVDDDAWQQEVQGYELVMKVVGDEAVAIPAFSSSLTVLCWGGDGEYAEPGGGVYAENGVVHCSGVSEMLLLLTAAKEEGLGKGIPVFQANMPIPSPAPFKSPLGEALRTHRGRWAERMRSLVLLLDDEDGASSSAGTSASSNHSSETAMQDFRSLSPTLLQYARYLLLGSGGGVSPPNLQGLLSDGLSSVWAGDYHLNVNLPMMFWGAGALDVGIGLQGLVSRPLVSFLQKLAHAGAAAAQELYNVSEGWVAHGFTDCTLRGGVLGEAHWALCVTCGAWAALSLLDVVLYAESEDSDAAAVEYAHAQILPVLVGAAQFFVAYMQVGAQGTAMTGPTSSPENSYLLKTKGPEGQGVASAQALALTPAIDVSILSQLSSSLNILLQWMRREGRHDLDFSKELAIAAQLSRLVSLLPNEGKPMVMAAEGSTVLEYPHMHMLSGQPGWGEVQEGVDPTHRHLSPLHFLHPNPFPPHLLSAEDRRLVRRGAEELLRGKGGGQLGADAPTPWSAAWSASSLSRLAFTREAVEVMSKVTARTLCSNLLSLHTPLVPVPGKGAEQTRCVTCYRESPSYHAQHAQVRSYMQGGRLRLEGNARAAALRGEAGEWLPSARPRGLVTEDDAKFQLDGNIGMASAILDTIVQSPVPPHLSLLPHASTPHPLPSGALHGLPLRGGGRLSMRWRNGHVEWVHLRVRSHFLLSMDLAPLSPTVYTLRERSNSSSDEILMLKLLSPSSLKIIAFSADGLVSCVNATVTSVPARSAEWGAGEGHVAHKVLFSVPQRSNSCSLFLCSQRNERGQCVQGIQEYLDYMSSFD